MADLDVDPDPFSIETFEWAEEDRALSPEGIAKQNAVMLRQYRAFRRAADAVAAAWRRHPEVVAVALIGSVARPPWKEVPRFRAYRRHRIALWHECKDLDLALWLSDLAGLDALRRAKDRTLRDLQDAGRGGVASHQVDVFVLEPGSDRYLGRLCRFNACPKGKPECRVPGCGATAFLRQHEDFHWRPETLTADRSAVLFDRTTNLVRHAAALPLPDGENEAETEGMP